MDNPQGRTQYEAKVASAEYQGGRDVYLRKRKTELNHIARLDARYREQQKREPDPDQDTTFSTDLHRLRSAEAFGLAVARRQVVNAVESFLLSCMEVLPRTGQEIIEKATCTRGVITLLPDHEADILATFGPPWVKNEQRNYD
jgi:hypothetical protein